MSLSPNNYLTIRSSIINTQDPWGATTPANPREGLNSLSQIIGELYLSHDGRFVEINQKNNPNRFETVISVCGYNRIQRSQPTMQSFTRETIETNLKERNVKWLQIGDAVPADEDSFYDIAWNATFPTRAKADFEIKGGSQDQDDVAFRAKKRNELQQLPPDQWFGPTFDLMREAVAGKRKLLVHCHKAVSRSPTVVAAFLIKEYHVSAEQAVAYLRSKRFCVDPKPMEDLRGYAQALQLEDDYRMALARRSSSGSIVCPKLG